MKKLFLLFGIIAALFTCTALFVACVDDDEEDGRQAAKEYCDCLEDGNSKDYCDEQFQEEYKYRTSDKFKKGFDAEGEYCDIELQIVTYN